MRDLSILIPARNEEFLARTIEDILSNIEADTEIIAVLDGAWAKPQIPQHERVSIIYLPTSVGQRAATNLAFKISKGKYVMKCDAHVAFDKGFDRKMLEAFTKEGDNVTMIPLMRNLHAFNWVCACGEIAYQDTGNLCKKCGKIMEKSMIWEPRRGTKNFSYCFDAEPHFQYFGEYTTRPEAQGDIVESMSIQGSCFMLSRKKYRQLNICDEKLGSWGSQGIEVACKTWLSGGRVLVNKNTWYAHMFRTKSANGFGFPYPISGNQVANAKKTVLDQFKNETWPLQIRPLSWLVEKFWPVKGWTDADLAKIKKKLKLPE